MVDNKGPLKSRLNLSNEWMALMSFSSSDLKKYGLLSTQIWQRRISYYAPFPQKQQCF